MRRNDSTFNSFRPYFKLELAIAMDHLEIGAIGSDQSGRREIEP